MTNSILLMFASGFCVTLNSMLMVLSLSIRLLMQLRTEKIAPSIRSFRCFVVALKVLPISFLLGVYSELERRSTTVTANAVPMAAAVVVAATAGVCCFILFLCVAKCVISISYWNGFGWFSVQTWLYTHNFFTFGLNFVYNVCISVPN